MNLPTLISIGGLLWHHTQLYDMLHGDSAIMLALTGAGGGGVARLPGAVHVRGPAHLLMMKMSVVQHLLMMKVSSLPQLHLLLRSQRGS